MSHLHATADLLEVARTTLRDEVVPHLPATARYPAAMVANALAIAARELALGPQALGAERELLARLYDSPPDATLDELRRRFCADLRAQRFGSDREPEIRTLLAALVQARLAISNPGYGATAPPEGGPS